MNMKLTLLILCATSLPLASDWTAVQQIPPAAKIEIVERNSKGHVRAAIVSASPDAIVVRETSGERSIARTEIRELKVFDSQRRTHRGVMWTLVGAGVGAGASLAACVSCSGEGHNTAKYLPLGIAVGAAVGALGFRSSPYRTVYKK
jgi:hypothetical protein